MDCRTFERRRQMLLRCGFVLLGYVFLLLLSRGYPVTCDDWYFTPKNKMPDFYNVYYRGFSWAKATAVTFNGRYLGNFLAGFLSTSELLRKAFVSAVIMAIVVVICRLCRARRVWQWVTIFTLVTAIPAAVFAQTYAWLAGFCNYVPPTLCVVGYMAVALRTFENDAKFPWVAALPMLLLGVCSQFFVENITLALCLLSGLLLVVFWKKRRRLSPELLAHFIGTLIGCGLMFAAVGYRNLGTPNDSYRSVATGLGGMFLRCAQNFTVITDQLTSNSWLTILPITAVCSYLVWRSSHKWKKLLLLGLLLPTAFFALNRFVLIDLREHDSLLYLLCAASTGANLVYLVSVFASVLCCVQDAPLRWKILLMLGAAVLFVAPMLLVSPVEERCMYLSQILLICALMFLLQAADFTPNRSTLIAGALLIAVLLGGYQLVMYKNAQRENLRIKHTHRAMSRGDTHIELPDYPYNDFVFGADSSAINYYYYYHTPGDIKFDMIPYDVWITNYDYYETENN